MHTSSIFNTPSKYNEATKKRSQKDGGSSTNHTETEHYGNDISQEISHLYPAVNSDYGLPFFSFPSEKEKQI